MGILVAFASVILIVMILLDGFEAIMLPRRVARKIRFTRIYYRSSWIYFLALVKRLKNPKTRSMLLSAYGPMSILILLGIWALGLILAFALLHLSIGSPLNPTGETMDFLTYLYLSGVTFFTLGFGDFTPSSMIGRMLAVAEAGLGFGFLAVIISYVPVLYQAFSRREATISLLDARAGSPPTAAELLSRLGSHDLARLDGFLIEWERWSAELLESSLSFPILVYYRSQHDNQSWLATLTLILDVSALAMTEIRLESTYQARLTFAMARHTLDDIAQLFAAKPTDLASDRLNPDHLHQLRTRLRAEGLSLQDGDTQGALLADLRGLYEPFLHALAEFCYLTVPPILQDGPVVDNWQTSAWMRRAQGLDRLTTGLIHDDHDD